MLIHIVCRDYACTALAGRARTRDGRRDADGRTYRSPLTSPLTARDAHTTRRVVTPGRTKSGRMQKQRPGAPPIYARWPRDRRPVRPLPTATLQRQSIYLIWRSVWQCNIAGLCKRVMAEPSGMLVSASTDVARARRWSNHLAPSGAVACREAQTRACRRFVPIASCCGTHANPDDSAHGGTCGACARRRT